MFLSVHIPLALGSRKVKQNFQHFCSVQHIYVYSKRAASNQWPRTNLLFALRVAGLLAGILKETTKKVMNSYCNLVNFTIILENSHTWWRETGSSAKWLTAESNMKMFSCIHALNDFVIWSQRFSQKNKLQYNIPLCRWRRYQFSKQIYVLINITYAIASQLVSRRFLSHQCHINTASVVALKCTAILEIAVHSGIAIKIYT